MLAQTFATDNASVAALLIAMFPALPASPLDQRFHLQVLLGFFRLRVNSIYVDSWVA